MAEIVRTIALISCSQKKADAPSPARDLYTSTLFRKSVTYAEATCESWLVLSARHGLVAPEEILAPYDQRLTLKPRLVEGRPTPTKWASEVYRDLCTRLGVAGLQQTTFVVLAGGIYEANLRALSIDMVFPLAGMQIGQRLQWLTEQVRR